MKDNKEKAFTLLEEAAKENKQFLHKLKILAVDHKKYEIAASLRDFEKDNFKDDNTYEKEHKIAQHFQTLLNMFGLNVPLRESYLVLEAAKMFNNKKECNLKTVGVKSAEIDKIFGL